MIVKNIELGEGQHEELRELVLIGEDRNLDIGLQVYIPEGASLQIRKLVVRECFVNLIKLGDGELIILEADFAKFGGDGFNIRGSNVRIGKLRVRESTPTRPYEEYHVDAVGQAYALDDDGEPDPDGLIENIVIDELDVDVDGEKTQGLMLSGACEYRGISVGAKKYKVLLGGYPFHFVANTLSDSVIGCKNGCEVSPGTQLKIKNVKGSKFVSSRVELVGFEVTDLVGDMMGELVDKDDVIVVGVGGTGRAAAYHESVSRGIRNCNPGNIEHNDKNKWLGLAKDSERVGKQRDEDRFCVFVDPVYGIRALAKLLQNYQSRRKLKTISQIIGVYAPAKDRNNTSVYVAVVCAALDVGPNDLVSMRDFDTLYDTVVAIIEHENGVANPYDEELIYRGLAMSGVDMPDELGSVDQGRKSKEMITGGTVIGGAATVPAIEAAKQYFEEPAVVDTVMVDTVENGQVVPVEVVKPVVSDAVSNAAAWYETVSVFDVAQFVFLGVIAAAAVMWMLDRRLTKKLGIR